MSSPTSTVEDGTRVWVAGVCIDALTEPEVVDQVIASLLVGRGGWIATPNVHFLRRASRDAGLSTLLSAATLRVADGVPLQWASQLARTPPLPRVTGASLMYSLSAAAGAHDRSVYILGGPAGAATDAATRLQEFAPGLRVVGAEGPWLSADVPDAEIEPILARLEAAKPDIVFCAFGFPKQEKVIAACRERLPSTWFLGCGAAVNFAAGHETRAPQWMQKVGLEWFHRVCSEPRRLAGRYAADIPFALGLLVRSGIRGRFAGALPVSVAPFPDEVVVLPDAAPARRDVIDVAHAEVGATAARIAPRNHG
jgi:N-acetylglucosaminyldiphosphoundecaprenol N-acetyl-beta-D-mannosaminyltransferase